MRKVTRDKVREPDGLIARGAEELRRARLHFSKHGVTDSFAFEVYKDPTVKEALEKLFHGKCAYCESPFSSVHPVDIEHYRPKGSVTGATGHDGYWWLAAAWDNLLPSCIDCNRRRHQKVPRATLKGRVATLTSTGFDRSRSVRTGKGMLFPLLDGARRAHKPSHDLGAEERLLLDPTRDNPDDHIEFLVRRENLTSLVLAKAVDAGEAAQLPSADDDINRIVADARAAGISPVGAVSIQVYGLNRLALVQARSRVLRDLEFLLELTIGLHQLADELTKRSIARKKKADATKSGTTKDRLMEDVRQDQRIAAKLEFYSNEAKSRIRSASLPGAQYSRLARAWIKEVVEPQEAKA